MQALEEFGFEINFQSSGHQLFRYLQYTLHLFLNKSWVKFIFKLLLIEKQLKYLPF